MFRWERAASRPGFEASGGGRGAALEPWPPSRTARGCEGPACRTPTGDRQTEPRLHTASFVVSSGSLLPPALWGQAAVVPGHLHRGNAVVPGSLLGQRLGARATARQGAHCLRGPRGTEGGLGALPSAVKGSGKFPGGSSDSRCPSCRGTFATEAERGPGAAQAALRVGGRHPPGLARRPAAPRDPPCRRLSHQGPRPELGTAWSPGGTRGVSGRGRGPGRAPGPQAPPRSLLSEPICAVGHGVAALCCATNEDRSWVFQGYSVTGVSAAGVAQQQSDCRGPGWVPVGPPGRLWWG